MTQSLLALAGSAGRAHHSQEPVYLHCMAAALFVTKSHSTSTCRLEHNLGTLLLLEDQPFTDIDTRSIKGNLPF